MANAHMKLFVRLMEITTSGGFCR